MAWLVFCMGCAILFQIIAAERNAGGDKVSAVVWKIVALGYFIGAVVSFMRLV